MKSLLAVFAGGVLGTAARLFFDYVLPHGDAGFPLSTLLINVAGSALLGFLVSRVWPTAAPWLRAGLGAGVLGSFTTFSAVVVAVVTLTDGGRMMLAVLYLALSLILGCTAAAAGLRIGVLTGQRSPSGRGRPSDVTSSVAASADAPGPHPGSPDSSLPTQPRRDT
jgi:CrcB protein